MKISPFTPLCFEPYTSDGLPSRYVQLWAPTDNILVEMFAETGEPAPEVTLYNARTGDMIDTIECLSWQMNTEKVMYFFELRGLSNGCYKLQVGDKTCDAFRITDDAHLLSRTRLIQYANVDNRQRDDAAFLIDNMPTWFDFRVPGGFKDSGWVFGVENEQFATQHADLVELYARDYVTKTFTLGGPEGVPVWYAELLNRLLTCQLVFINGERFARNESEVPSMTTLVDGLDSFVFTQVLRKVTELEGDLSEQSHIAMRRLDSDYYRSALIENEKINRLII